LVMGQILAVLWENPSDNGVEPVYGALMEGYGGVTSGSCLLRDAEKYSNGDYKIGLNRRTDANEKNEKSDKYVLRKSHLISPKDEMIDLTPEEKDAALQKMNQYKGSTSDKPSGPFIRDARSPQNGLLLVYLLDPAKAGTVEPVVGLAFSFPVSINARKIKYRVNNVYAEQELGINHA